MALDALSPWPAATATVTLGDARAWLDAALGGTGDRFQVRNNDDTAWVEIPAPTEGEDAGFPARRIRRDLLDRLGSTASALVEAYAPAPDAPQAREATRPLSGSPGGSKVLARTKSFCWTPVP